MSAPSRWPYLVVAYLCLALAAVGIAVPGLPTTPFLLVAAWAAARGSERLHAKLRAHPRFGPLIRAWQEEGAIPTRAKVITLLLLPPSWLILTLHVRGWVVPAVTAALFVVIGWFVVSRPAPRA